MKGNLNDWPYRQEVPLWRRLLAWLPGQRPPERGMGAWQRPRGSAVSLGAPSSTSTPEAIAAEPAIQTPSQTQRWRAFLQIYNVFGRASRGQYWLFMFVTLFIVLPALVSLLFLLPRELERFVALVWLLFGPAIALALIAMTIRRYHDTGRRAWALPFMFTNPISGVMVLWRLFGPSEVQPNRFGPRP